MSHRSEVQASPITALPRRQFLKVLGGSFIVASAGFGLYAATRTPTKAIEPWKMALGPGKGVDPRRIILSHAILAPNPHNRQPWVVDLDEPDVMTLYCDLDRRLPHTDPFDRQITIGLGCFLELADMTALQIGKSITTELFPQGEGAPRLDKRPVARMVLNNGPSEVDPLFAQIFNRRSNKDPYDTSRKVAASTAMEILSVARNASAGKVIEPKKVNELREIAWAAMETEMRTFRTAKESVDLMRIGKAEIEANPDGIDLGGVFFETMTMLGQFSREKMLEFDFESTFFKQTLAALRPAFDTASGFVYLKTSTNSRRAQINAGRDYVRMNMKATELGVSMHPFSQALQEFPEVSQQFTDLRDALGIEENETVQMFARIGYGDFPEPSPRWPHESRIRKA